MENATISISEKKKGKLVGSIKFENGKSMPIPVKFDIALDMDGKVCNVERIDGRPVKIVVDGRELKRKEKNQRAFLAKNNYKNRIDSYDRQSRVKRSRSAQTSNSDIFTATAPYNFVPLNKRIVTQEKPHYFDKYYGNTGYIDLEIETKTPIYIGGAKNKEGEENFDFYNQAGKYRIPGSSLRGMIRTMVEIVSWSRLSIFNDGYLYYRSFADKANSIKSEYSKHMVSADAKGNTQYSMSSGLLYKNGLNYFIIPATKKFEKLEKRISRRNPNYPHYYGYIELDSNKYLVVPGKKFKPRDENKQNDWIVYADKRNTSDAFKIPDNDVLSYKNDKNRNRKVPDITKLKNGEFRPCFYVRWKDKNGKDRISFGHTPLFRISYEKTIGEHINQGNSEKGKFDMSESIFGNKSDFMTRIFFEDAFLTKDSYGKVAANEKESKILSSPKPTSFQLYLEQSDVNNVNYLKHYNSETDIRGYKLYWHQNGDDWKETDKNNVIKHKTQYTKLKPIYAGAKFIGRIRFDNLIDIELGTLLFAVDLPKGLAHKIGMAKPFGLGSIRINSKLYLSNRVNRYKNLFAEWSGLEDKSESINKFKSAFENYIIKKLGENKDSLWKTNRLKELRKMLNFEDKPVASKIKYMSIKQFGERKILPNPAKIS